MVTLALALLELVTAKTAAPILPIPDVLPHVVPDGKTTADKEGVQHPVRADRPTLAVVDELQACDVVEAQTGRVEDIRVV